MDIPWVNLIWKAYYQNGTLPDHNSKKGSFWWRNCLSYLKEFKDMTSIITSKGNTLIMWHDKWQDTPLCNKYPELFSFAKHQKISVHDAIQISNNDDMFSMFHLPLSLIAEE